MTYARSSGVTVVLGAVVGWLGEGFAFRSRSMTWMPAGAGRVVWWWVIRSRAAESSSM